MNNLSELQLTPEILDKIDECTTPGELIKLAKDNGVKLSLEEAKNLLEFLDKDLTDEELAEVAGGVCWSNACTEWDGSTHMC